MAEENQVKVKGDANNTNKPWLRYQKKTTFTDTTIGL